MQKTKRTTFSKDTQTNKNKEILHRYNTRSFLASRKSFVEKDVEDVNKPELTATVDEETMRDENEKLKEDLATITTGIYVIGILLCRLLIVACYL